MNNGYQFSWCLVALPTLLYCRPLLSRFLAGQNFNPDGPPLINNPFLPRPLLIASVSGQWQWWVWSGLGWSSALTGLPELIISGQSEERDD